MLFLVQFLMSVDLVLELYVQKGINYQAME